MNSTMTHTENRSPQTSAAQGARTVRPRADIYETNDAWLLVLDLPGADENGTDISIEKHILTVSADPDNFVPEGFERVHTEFLPRRYERSFRLPDEIDVSGIAANVKNGVLRLSLPKSTEARPQRIAVKAG